MILKFFLLLILCQLFYSFTLSTSNFYLISDPSGQQNSYFGYSLLLRSSVTGYDASIIIGAPTANSTYETHTVLDRPGAVYQCLLKPKFSNLDTQCRQLILDPAGNDNGTQHDQQYRPEKSQAWIGAAIDGDNVIEGLFIACGPRWKDQMYENFILPNGICYFMKNTLTMNSIARSFIPLIDKSKQVYLNTPYYAFGEAGFSVHLTHEKIKRVLLGAVGVYVFKGTVIETDFEQINNKDKPMKIMNPKNISQLIDNSYLGYSLGSGVFLRNSTNVWIVSGAPRGASLNGQVFIMNYDQNDNLEVFDVLEGDQIGSYFGSTICVVDLNSDGVSDLLIGAPMYTTHTSDEGAVFVFFGNGEGKFIKKDQVYVENIGPNSRFGSAISHLGDINNDRYVDVVIGAPYENDGTGSIYVYLGTRNGLEKQFIQRIRALDLSPILKAFGSSFSRNLDIDKNQCNDIAVGAYKSGHVVVLLSKPEVKVDTVLEPNTKKVTTNTTAITLKLCFNYTGLQAPRKLIIDVWLGADKRYQRTDMMRQKTVFNGIAVFNKSLIYEKLDCEDIVLRIKKNIRQNSNPIVVSLSYTIRNTDKYEFKNPVLNPRSRNNFSVSILVEPEFSLQIIRQSIPNQLLYISGTEIELKKRLEHNYDIVNNGPSSTDQLIIIFYIPTIKNVHDQNNKIELIKLETSELYVTDVTISCQLLRNDLVSNNYLGPQIEDNLKIDSDKTEYINCSFGENIKCERLKCFVPKIRVNSTPIIVKLKLNLQWNNFDKLTDGKKELIVYTSMMQIMCKPLCKNTAEYYFTHTVIYVPSPIQISIWITLFAILVGLGVLFVIAFVLYKVGFYQRNERDRLRLIKDSEENENFYKHFETDVAID